MGAGARRPLRRRRRPRGRRPGARQRRRGDPAAARLRRGPGRHLPRPRAAADPPLPRLLPLDRGALGRATPSSTSASTARWSGLPGKMLAPQRVLRPRRGARLAAARLPVRRQRPRRGRAGQAPRPRHDRRPPRPADDARRHLRRDGRARGAARRVRAPGGARPVQAARPRRAHLVGDRARQPAGRPRHPRAARGRRQARRAHRRLPVRGQGHPDQGRPARARPRAARAISCAGSCRPCCGSARATCRACAAPSARPSDSTSRRWWRRAARRSQRAPDGLVERFRGPSASAGDLVDRLEDAHMALLDALAARDWTRERRGGGVHARSWAAPTPASSARCASPATRSSRGSCARPTS